MERRVKGGAELKVEWGKGRDWGGTGIKGSMG